jgi:hypothetical protein
MPSHNVASNKRARLVIGNRLPHTQQKADAAASTPHGSWVQRSRSQRVLRCAPTHALRIPHPATTLRSRWLRSNGLNFCHDAASSRPQRKPGTTQKDPGHRPIRHTRQLPRHAPRPTTQNQHRRRKPQHPSPRPSRIKPTPHRNQQRTPSTQSRPPRPRPNRQSGTDPRRTLGRQPHLRPWAGAHQKTRCYRRRGIDVTEKH